MNDQSKPQTAHEVPVAVVADPPAKPELGDVLYAAQFLSRVDVRVADLTGRRLVQGGRFDMADIGVNIDTLMRQAKYKCPWTENEYYWMFPLGVLTDDMSRYRLAGALGGQSDIDPKYSSLVWSAVRFRHLTAGAKAAVRAAGGGTLRSGNGGCYEAIRPPKRTTRALIRLAVCLPVMLGGAVGATALFSYLGVRVVAVPGGIVLIDNFAQMAAQIAYGLWGMLIYSALFRK